MAASLADCDAMIAAAREGNVKLAVISQRRFYEPVMRLKAAIDAGKIGTPVLGTVLMLSWRDEAYYRSDPWRGRWDTEGGGVLVNQSPHQLDLLRWFMGPIRQISRRVRQPEPSLHRGGRHCAGHGPLPQRGPGLHPHQPVASGRASTPSCTCTGRTALRWASRPTPAPRSWPG